MTLYRKRTLIDYIIDNIKKNRIVLVGATGIEPATPTPPV